MKRLNPFRYIKRIDWYIIKKFIGTYVFSILLIISISIVFDVNENLAKFTQYHAPLHAIVFDYYANFVPYFANLFSALFVFIAVTYKKNRININFCAFFSIKLVYRKNCSFLCPRFDWGEVYRNIPTNLRQIGRAHV